MKRTGGLRESPSSVSRSMPVREVGSSLRPSSEAAVGASCAFSSGDVFSAGMPARSADSIVGRRFGQNGGARLQVDEQLPAVDQERPDRRQGLGGRAPASPVSSRSSPAGTGGRSRRRRRRCRRGRRTCSPGSRRPAPPQRPSGSGPGRTGRAGPRLGQGPGHALEPGQQRLETADRLVQVGAAAGERITELDDGSPDRLAGGRVERVQNLVELDRGRRRLRERDRSALRDSPDRCRRGRSRRYLSPSADRALTITVESIGSGSTVLSSFSTRFGLDATVLVAGRHDLLDDANPDTADPDLVAGDEAGRVRQLRGEPVGRRRTAARCWRCRRGTRRGSRPAR